MSSEFRRAQVATIVQRLSEPPDRLVAVFGPRQTGKTTAVRQALAILDRDHRFESVDDPGPRAAPRPFESGVGETAHVRGPRDRRWLEEVWADSRRRAWDSRRGFVLVLDEIQKIAGWSETVKGLWDADRADGCPLHVVILGSAPLLMQAGLNESLAGRFEQVRFTHWSFTEMSEAFDFDLERYAKRSFGTFQEEPVEVVLRFDAAAARDASTFVFHSDRSVDSNDDGSLTVRFEAGGIDEMCWHLFTWGESVTI